MSTLAWCITSGVVGAVLGAAFWPKIRSQLGI